MSILAGAFAAIAGAQVNVTVDATNVVRPVDNRVFGLNTAVWDSSFSDPQTLASLKAMDTRTLRFPGGSTSDTYHWLTNMSDGDNFKWATDFDAFASTAQAIGAQVVITANYGSGNPLEAAAWVTYSNVFPHVYGFKYWEIGNECYGTWENDTHALQWDPYTYATWAVQYITAMKAVDPTIKIGVVAVTGEDSDSNGYTAHPATNLSTGKPHNGWTPVMLATMKTLGVLPDFLIYHRYDGTPLLESDSVLLQAALTWPADAANLRQQLTDYLGASGAAVELVVTENNSVYSNPGKQSVSLVNGLYMADSTANVLQTEFNGLIWWDLHNGQSAGTAQSPVNLSSSLYGWREYGDYGVESGNTSQVIGSNPTHSPYPTYYSMKLMSNFARGGDSVVKASSDNTLLSAYAVKRVNGTLSILVINKSPTVTYSVNFALTGYSPISKATVHTYGIPQDTAAQTGSGSPDVAVSSISDAGTTFAASVAPYSLTLFSLTTPTTTPSATSQPASQTIASGSTVVFSFAANGTPAPTYQWSLNGIAMPSATTSTLVITGATLANAGSYTCVATNSSGSIESDPASLTVVSTGNPGRLINLSCRAQVGTGGNIIIGGFVIGPPGMSGSESVLVRGSGPALAQFNLTGVLPDPTLVLDNVTNAANPVFVATNTGWVGSSTIASAAHAVGAFSWGTSATADSALLEPLPVGNYTAEISGASGDKGVALVEVYDATPAGTYTLASPRLVNLSARVQVGTGANVVFAGFVIGGSTAKTVLIRASGPALAPFDVPGVLPDPQLTLTNVTTLPYIVVTTNTVWGGDPEINAVAGSVGAFQWSLTGNDSAILITLPPGNYTAGVQGAVGDTGIALVEVYEVP